MTPDNRVGGDDYLVGGEDRAAQAEQLLASFEPLFKSLARRFARYGQDRDNLLQEARLVAWKLLLDERTNLQHPGLPGYLKLRVHGHLTDLFNRQVGRDRREGPELPDTVSRVQAVRKAQVARVADWQAGARKGALAERLRGVVATLPEDLAAVARHVLAGGDRRSFWKENGLDRRRGAELWKRTMAELKHQLANDEG